jgi:hypothetical protein
VVSNLDGRILDSSCFKKSPMKGRDTEISRSSSCTSLDIIWTTIVPMQRKKNHKTQNQYFSYRHSEAELKAVSPVK